MIGLHSLGPIWALRASVPAFTFRFHTTSGDMVYYANYQTNPFVLAAPAVGGVMNQADGATNTTYLDTFTADLPVAFAVNKAYRTTVQLPTDGSCICIEIEIGSDFIINDNIPYVAQWSKNGASLFNANASNGGGRHAAYYANGNQGGNETGSSGDPWTTGDRIGIVHLTDDPGNAGAAAFYKNGVLQGSFPMSGWAGTERFFTAGYNNEG